MAGQRPCGTTLETDPATTRIRVNQLGTENLNNKTCQKKKKNAPIPA